MADIYNPQLPSSQVQTPSVNYQQQYNLNSPFGQILSKMGQNLSAMTPFTKSTPFEQYAAPYREQAKMFTESTLRPQFERYQKNPFELQQSAQGAAGGSRMMGNAPGNFSRALDELYMQSYYPQQMQIQNYFDSLARQLYNEQGGQAYTGANAFTNLGL